MNISVISFIVTCCVVVGNAEDNTEDCNKDVSREFVENYFKFCAKIFRITGSKHFDHFVISPYNVWLTLAAVGEGSTGSAQEEIFSALNLPQDLCLRQKYYEMALRLNKPALDVIFARKRFVVFDKDVRPNNTWVHSVVSKGLVKIVSLPLKSYPALAAYHLTVLSSSRVSKKHVVGNSLLLDSLDYTGRWTTEFSHANIKYNMPFYNDAGHEIGKVDLLTSYRKAKMSYIPALNSKGLFLPVGTNSRYILLFAVNLDQNNIKHTIDNFMDSDLSYALNNSYDATDLVKIAIPQFTFTTVIENMKAVLEDLDIKSLWKDEEATALISEHAANPVSYVHRVTINVNRFGTEREHLPVVPISHPVATHPVLGDTFIVNRPFIFALIDPQTLSPHFCGVYSKPTFQYS